MEQGTFFPYTWHVDEDEEEVTLIRIYGLTEDNKNVCLRVDNFTPYVYIELPDHIKWTDSKAQIVGNKIDEIMGRQRPIRKALVNKKRLYVAHFDANGNRKLFPYLFCSFSSRKDARSLSFKLKRTINIVGIGPIKLKMHEAEANEVLQLTCCKDLPTAGWIEFYGKKQTDDEKLTLCDFEYKVKWKNMKAVAKNTVPRPKILGFDIEVNSSNPSAMPDAHKPGDKVFQISCVLCRYGDSRDIYQKYLLSLGDPDQNAVGENVIIYKYATESDLLEGFTEFVRVNGPNIITGYNILCFDIPYMIERAKLNMCIFNFDKMGFHKFSHAREKSISWSSSAYKNQEFCYLDTEGRVFVDLLPLIQRDFKFANYKLKTVSEFFLKGETKADLSVKGIFKCYRVGTKTNDKGEYSKSARKAMGICGKYCVQDSALVVLLMEKLQTWIGLTEMAKTCQVQIFTLYTQGQQIKVYSQIYKYCMNQNIVVETDAYQAVADERYRGATVFDPVPGKYVNVVPFDFASLYPTSIIAYNIDYHTWVPDDSDIPDSKCHVMEWEDHVSCIAAGTLVNSGEMSNYIEDMFYTKESQLMAYDEKSNGVRHYKQTNFFDQNVRDCIRLILEDGSTLVCTPDHKILVCESSASSEKVWVEASLVKNKKVVCSYIPPVYEVGNRELVLRNYTFTGTRLVGFYKLLGLFCMNGYLDCGRPAIKCRNMTDLQSVKHGLLSLEKKCVQINKGVLNVTILGKLGEVFKDLDEIQTVDSLMVSISNPEACAFLSGVFGSVSYRLDYTQENYANNIVRFDWGERGVSPFLKCIQSYLFICGIKSIVHNSRYLEFTNVNFIKLKTMVGVSYNSHKKVQFEAIYSYIKTHTKTEDFPLYILSHGFDNKNIGVSIPCFYKSVIGVLPVGKRQVYDLEVDRSHTFIANGIIVHNCIHDPKMIRKQTLTTYIDNEKAEIKKLRTKKNMTKDKLRKKELMADIEKRVEELKPYTKERSGITKAKFPMCAKRRYRFLKEPRGVLPTVIQNLLDARAHTRKVDIIACKNKIAELKEIEKTTGEDKSKEIAEQHGLINVLDKRQLAYKVSANSMYGAMGVRRGYLPFMPGAMCTTYMGRINIDLTSKIIVEKHKGQFIYGDTDSNYISFPHITSIEELWNYAEYVAKEISKCFPPPMKLEFEEAIYTFFLILTKKRYVDRKVTKERGEFKYSDNLGKKGVLLARRDSSKFVKYIYENVINKVADNVSKEEIVLWVLDEINTMFSGSKTPDNFVITKAVGNIDNLTAIPFVNEKGVKKAKVGDYTVPILSDNKNEREKQLIKKEVSSSREYYLTCLPAQVQLAEKMRRRGTRVDNGTRLEYVITDPKHHKAKQYKKIESLEYYVKFREVIKIDYFYYLKALSNPLDQLLSVVFPDLEEFVLKQYKFRLQNHKKMMEELETLFSPKIIFET